MPAWTCLPTSTLPVQDPIGSFQDEVELYPARRSAGPGNVSDHLRDALGVLRRLLPQFGLSFPETRFFVQLDGVMPPPRS